ncbi:MAG: 2-oxo acid dehydrogenase subunit E2 [Anaerolineae bacterium]|nr:2-oxo acid dehydrogenase subunit E2 [Anaerolineae bacterium]
MATEIKIPKLGMAMREATVVKWLKADGEAVTQGEPIVEIESEKINFQVEAPASGVLHHLVREQEVGPVGAHLGLIAAPGETIIPSVQPTQALGVPTEVRLETPKPTDGVVPSRPGSTIVSPAAKRLAREHGVDVQQVTGTGPGGRIVENDIWLFLETHKEPRISPVAKKVADSAGVDVAHVAGTGPHGRIVREDVERVIHQRAAASSAHPGQMQPSPSVPFTGMRSTIARRMMASLQTTAQVTLFTECDVTELVHLREYLRQEFELTYTDLIIQATARALEKHPRLNAALDGDQIHLHHDIHIGMAVALEEGLIVPVIRDANRKTLRDIARETKDLAERARNGMLVMDEVSGATFSVTNLGRYGIDGFTPIINPPEVAILGVGRIIEKPAAYHGSVALRQMVTLSLTHDHRLVDGAPAAAFLHTVAEILAMPYLLCST